MRRLISCALCLAALAGRAAASEPSGLFARAAAQYDAGLYFEAIDLYDSLLSAGYEEPVVYFNMGNAYFRAGDVGRAIWAYRAAELRAPRDLDIEANLTVARLAARDRIEVVPAGFLRQMWGKLARLLSLREGARAATIAWWLFWLALAGWLFRPPFRPWLGPVTRWLGLLWVAAFVVLAARYLETRNTQLAVVVADTLDARSGPGGEFDVVFSGHSGLECAVRGRRNDYLMVELANGRVGWVTASSVALVPS
jgi:tetratricopeptide (TPR) repeat protein